LTVKEELRSSMKVFRDGLSRCESLDSSEGVCIKLQQLCKKLKPKVVHAFIPFGSEIDIWPVVKELKENGTTIVCPKTLKGRALEHLVLNDPSDLESGKFGTQHPSGSEVYSGQIDLILVPGLAFDARGGRLGYGAGYYDTFLAEHPDAFKAGICFRGQLVDEVPMEEHDVFLDQIIVG
jgi:5-formyltetrahydrofolate cyclo-ligase